MEMFFPLQPCFVASTLDSLNNSLVLAPIFCFASLVGSQPCFPLGGVGYFSMCSQQILSITPVCIPQTVFRILCMSSIFLGRRPDGSSLILARPHVWGQCASERFSLAWAQIVAFAVAFFFI